jgi:hypothetical protein
MDREVIARACRNAGLSEELRKVVMGYDVFIADGFSSKPAETFWRFGITPTDFPSGCYATFYWIARGEDHVELGVPMFFEPFHNPELANNETRKKARINTALREAESFLKKRQKVRKENGK